MFDQAQLFDALPWFIEVALLLALIIVAVIRFTSSVARDGWSTAFGKALLWIIIADLVAFIPLCITMPIELPNIIEGLFNCIYMVVQTIGVEAPVSEAQELAHSMLDNTQFECLASMYGAIVGILALVTPLVVVTTAISKLRERLAGIELWLLRRRHHVVYVFSDMNDVQVTLARDILRHRAEAAKPTVGLGAISGSPNEEKDGLRPLVLFSGVKPERFEEDAYLIGRLRDKGKGDVVFIRRKAFDLVDELGKFDSVHCFFFGEEHAKNVQETTSLITEICLGALRSVAADEKLDEATSKAEAFATRFSVYCSKEGHEDELLFDSLSSEGSTPDDEDLACMLSQDEQRAVMDAARKRIEVRLISPAKERALWAMTQYPLFDELDGVDLSKRTGDEIAPQQLWFVICGLTTTGFEALRCAYWMGRMHAVILNILCIDEHATEMSDVIGTKCPEMMAERHQDGTLVVNFVEAAPFTSAFSEALDRLPKDARVYAMVTYGDDQTNLTVALALRRAFDEMTIAGKLENRGRHHLPKVLPYISDSETFSAVERMVSDRQESFDITPFGRTGDVFSFSNIIASPWERYALAMAASYLEMFGSDEPGKELYRGSNVYVDYGDAVVDYSEFEIKKDSNRTAVRHIPYRLWTLGFDPKKHFDEHGNFIEGTLTKEKWFEKLGVSKKDADEILRLKSDLKEGADAEDQRRAHDAFNERYPVLGALADLEHERWMAFYRSCGWRDLTIEDLEALVELGVIAKRSTHQSPKLRRHSYLCELDTLFERGAALQDDPCVYDRASIVEVQRVLAGTIFEAPAGIKTQG